MESHRGAPALAFSHRSQNLSPAVKCAEIQRQIEVVQFTLINIWIQEVPFQDPNKKHSPLWVQKGHNRGGQLESRVLPKLKATRP